MPDLAAIDSIWKLLDRPLWAVTAAAAHRRGGLIATWITQNSLSPQTPQIVAGIAPNHFTCELIDRSSGFGLHLLNRHQLDLVERFAVGSGRDRDKLADLELLESGSATPILAECHAWMECRVFARLDAGDRVFFWADVVNGGSVANADAGGLLRESDLGQLPPEVIDALREDRDHDIHDQLPLAQQWRLSLPAQMAPKSHS